MNRALLLLCTAAVLTMPCAAEPQAIEVVSPHFTLVTDAGEKQARQLLDNFERMRWMFHTLFPKLNVDPAEPMVIVAVRNKKEFQTLEPAEYLAKGQINLAGYFLSSNDKHYILLRLDGENEHPFATVYHEYTHLQFRSAGPWIPLWLNEGIAEFFQNTEFRDKQVLLGEPSADDILFLRQNQLIPLTTLFRVDHDSPYYHDEEKGSIFYAESWALTHYLQITDRQKGTNRVSDYMIRMSRHEDPVAAAQEAFGDLKVLQRQLESYVRAQQYMQFVMNSAAAPIDSSAYQVKPLSTAEFNAQRADVLAHVGRSDEARSLLDSLGASGASLPDAFDTRGFLAWSAGDTSAALRAYQRAMELGSRNFFVYFNAASLMQMGDRDEAGITAALLRTTQLNPSFAPAFDELAQWDARHDDTLDEAHAMSIKAILLDTGNFYYRLHAGDIELRQNRFDAAEGTFRLARTLASTSSETGIIDHRLEELAAVRSSPSLKAGVREQADNAHADQPQVLIVQSAPRHTAGPPTGPRHTVVGIMNKAECSYPVVLDLELTAKVPARILRLYAGDFTKIDLSSDSARTADTLNPCKDFNGRTAKIVYAETADKTADGQIVSIELQK